MIAWRIARDETDQERGIQFLCRHGGKLGIPYSWITVLNSIMYSLEDRGFLIGVEEDGTIAGALVFTVGTRDDRYKDPGRIELHLLCLDEPRRVGAVLLGALRAFVQQLLELPREVREVVFYTAADTYNRGLFGKAAKLTSTAEQPCGMLDFYSIKLESLLRLDR